MHRPPALPPLSNLRHLPGRPRLTRDTIDNRWTVPERKSYRLYVYEECGFWEILSPSGSGRCWKRRIDICICYLLVRQYNCCGRAGGGLSDKTKLLKCCLRFLQGGCIWLHEFMFSYSHCLPNRTRRDAKKFPSVKKNFIYIYIFFLYSYFGFLCPFPCSCTVVEPWSSMQVSCSSF